MLACILRHLQDSSLKLKLFMKETQVCLVFSLLSRYKLLGSVHSLTAHIPIPPPAFTFLVLQSLYCYFTLSLLWSVSNGFNVRKKSASWRLCTRTSLPCSACMFLVPELVNTTTVISGAEYGDSYYIYIWR